MDHRVRIFCLILLVALLGACSTGDEAVPVTTAPVTESPVTPSPLALSPGAPSATSPGSGSDQEATAAGPLLSGLLYHLGFVGNQLSLFALDLAGGAETTIFTPPENAWLSELALSPDGSQILLAYSLPPEEGQVQYGFTDLYLMPADGSAPPVALLEGEDPSETFFNISWPVDDFIYYAHFIPTIAEDGLIIYGSQVERMHLPDGAVEQLAPGAAWARVSNDGSMLAYVTDTNELILAGGNGSNPTTILDSEAFPAVDAPLFSPDNKLICFSAVERETAALPSMINRLLGLKIAYAHNVPSDWYCLPLDGSGEPHRLTNLDGLGLYGDFSPGGDYMAFMSTAGIYVIKSDGSDLRQLQEGAQIGTLNWAP